MPNWCLNSLTLRHNDAEMIGRAATAAREGRLFAEFVPVPPSLQIVAGFLGDNAEQEKLEVLEEANLDIHGYKNWYDFCVGEWGTKWEASEVDINQDDGNEVTLAFDTAWAPPLGFYEKMLDLGFEVVAQYYEPGMAFVGAWDNGQDECYNIPGDPESVRQEIPQAIDEFWNISEDMEEYQND